MSLAPPLKTHGGKHYLKEFVIDHFPEGYEEMKYFEPFIGGGSVFLNKKRSKFECISDVDEGTYSVWFVLATQLEEFTSKLNELEYSEETFNSANSLPNGTLMESAIREMILRRMSRGGMMEAFAWSKRLRNNKPGDVNAWENNIKKLAKVGERLERTSILLSDFREMLRNFSGEKNSFFYLDPPYLPSTRKTKAYRHEMTLADHLELLALCLRSKAKIALSGYSSVIYNESLKGWRKVTEEIVNHSGQSKKKENRIECLWMNY